jgi:regulator of protease activity HflC (stomatin/prohibitin superfamily)
MSQGRNPGVVVALAAVALLVLVLLWGSLASFKSVGPGTICVVQEGGPFDGRDVKSVRQPSSGVSSIGIWNKQRCLPATERFYTLSANPEEADSKTIDAFKTPTLDAVEVNVEGQARFTLSTDPEVVEQFYKRYGVRAFDGLHPYDGDEGWENFLFRTFRPVLRNTLRESIGKYRCVELNNTCQYVQNTEAVTEGKIEEVATGQNLDKIGTEVASNLHENLRSTLGADYFENVRFNLERISFEPEVERAVTAAQTKRTEVANARLDAQRAREIARGKRLAAAEEARAIIQKQRAYAANPTAGDIDRLHALCGDQGCENLQVLGGEVSRLVR